VVVSSGGAPTTTLQWTLLNPCCCCWLSFYELAVNSNSKNVWCRENGAGCRNLNAALGILSILVSWYSVSVYYVKDFATQGTIQGDVIPPKMSYNRFSGPRPLSCSAYGICTLADIRDSRRLRMQSPQPSREIILKLPDNRSMTQRCINFISRMRNRIRTMMTANVHY